MHTHPTPRNARAPAPGWACNFDRVQQLKISVSVRPFTRPVPSRFVNWIISGTLQNKRKLNQAQDGSLVPKINVKTHLVWGLPAAAPWLGGSVRDQEKQNAHCLAILGLFPAPLPCSSYWFHYFGNCYYCVAFCLSGTFFTIAWSKGAPLGEQLVVS